MHNSELADVLGNLIHRVVTLTHKYCGGVVPQQQQQQKDGDLLLSLPFDLEALKKGVQQDLEDCCINAALFKAMVTTTTTTTATTTITITITIKIIIIIMIIVIIILIFVILTILIVK